ncbi:hypothetical protein CRENBAI_013448 [Crenichthys baileyi]|uniref:Uncharacterized protein n=1 Tax=Crenichthys baileyi TaxID=28760 RepID=A0AAV9SIA2_9TELE
MQADWISLVSSQNSTFVLFVLLDPGSLRGIYLKKQSSRRQTDCLQTTKQQSKLITPNSDTEPLRDLRLNFLEHRSKQWLH